MHEVDICVIKPLVTIPEIAHVKKCWVDRPKSHAKMVTQSAQYRALFIAVQKFVIQKEGHQGAGMTTIIGNLKLIAGQWTISRFAKILEVVCRAVEGQRETG